MKSVKNEGQARSVESMSTEMRYQRCLKVLVGVKRMKNSLSEDCMMELWKVVEEGLGGVGGRVGGGKTLVGGFDGR